MNKDSTDGHENQHNSESKAGPSHPKPLRGNSAKSKLTGPKPKPDTTKGKLPKKLAKPARRPAKRHRPKVELVTSAHCAYDTNDTLCHDRTPRVIDCHCGNEQILKSKNSKPVDPLHFNWYGWRIIDGEVKCPRCAFGAIGHYKTECCGHCGQPMTTEAGPFGPDCMKTLFGEESIGSSGERSHLVEQPDENSAPKEEGQARGKSFPSPAAFDDLDVAELIAQEIPSDPDIPESIRLNYVLAVCKMERIGSVQVKQLRYRVGKVLAPIHDELVPRKAWKDWVHDSGIPRTRKTLYTWIQVSARATPEQIDDPETTWTQLARELGVIGEDGRIRFPNNNVDDDDNDGDGNKDGNGAGTDNDGPDGVGGTGTGNGNSTAPLSIDNIGKRSANAAKALQEIRDGLPNVWAKSKTEACGTLEKVLETIEGIATNAHAIASEIETKLEEVQG